MRASPNAHRLVTPARALTVAVAAWGALVIVASVTSIASRTPWSPTVTGGQATLPPAADRVIAEAGYSAVAPENTLAAVRAAAAAGVPRVWLDVRTTSDGQLVLLRDETLDRTTDCRGTVRQQPAASVTRCDAGARFDPSFAGETVPRLADALAISEVRFFLALRDAAPAAVLDGARAAGAVDRIIVVSANEAALAELRARAPGVPAWLQVAELTPDAGDTARRLGVAGVAVDPGGLVAVEAAALRATGIELAAVGVADEATMFDLLAAEVDHVVTARVEPAVRAMGLQFRTYPATAFGTASLAQQAFASALATGDFNGDGRPDLAVGAPFDGSRVANGGWVGIALGGGTFPTVAHSEAGAEREGQWGEQFTVGDYNDDGFDDLVVGYPRRDFIGVDSGILWLWDGGATGIGRGGRPAGPEPQPGSELGAALASGDFNGDGVDDLLVGAPQWSLANQAGAGRVVVMPGVADGGPTAGNALFLDRARRDVPGDPTARERFGDVVAMGDFDGDRYADAAIGVPLADVDDARDAGSVVVAFGGPDDPITDTLAAREIVELTRADPRVPGDAERDATFGAALTAADFDGDGFDDLAIGSPNASVQSRRAAGDVVVLYGGAAGFDFPRAAVIDQDTPLVPDASEPRDQFGGVLAAGDLDGDGYPDLAVGAAHESGERLTDVGALTVVYAGPGGLRPRVALGLAPGMPPLGAPPATRLAFAQALAIADLNGDGAADLAVGAPGMAVGAAAGAGALVVAWGYHPDLPGVPTATVPMPTAGSPSPSPAATPSATPTPSPTLPTAPAVTASATPSPTATPRPPRPAYLPVVIRLRAFFERWPTPMPGADR